MMKFRLLKKEAKLWNSGYMALYDYMISSDNVDRQNLDDFLDPHNYSIDDDSALGNPFNISLLKNEDFKTYTFEQLCTFFDDFAAPNRWTKPEEIAEEIEYLKVILSESESNHFYFISTDMFNHANPKTEFSGMAYIYYFLIFWFNKKNMKICQMCMD